MRYIAAAIGNEAMTCHGDIKNRDINKTTWDTDDIKMGINDINREFDDTIRDTDRNSNDIKWEGSTINREVNHTDFKNKMKYFDNTDMKFEAFDSNSIEEADDEMNKEIADSQLTAGNADNREITNQIVVDKEVGDDNDGSKTTHTDNSDWEDTDQKMDRKGTMEKSGMDFTSTRKVTTNIADMSGEMHNRMLDNYDYEREITNQIVVD